MGSKLSDHGYNTKLKMLPGGYLKPNLKKTIGYITIFLILGLILLPLLAQEVVHEYKIPSGWKFKRYHSGALYRALYLLPNLPDEQLVRGDVPRRLLIFDSQDNLISDLTLEPWWWLHGFIGEKILLEEADENATYSIKLVDLNGKEIYSLDTQERWVSKAIIGNDLALEPSPIHNQVGPISIIDGETGQEKFRFGPYQGPNGPSIPDCFLLIGEGYYLVGTGASLFLKSYYEPEKTYWQILNIGENIKQATFLNRDLIAVGYGFDDFKKGVFMSGVAVIEWRTGAVLFNKNAIRHGKNEDKWFNSFDHLLLSVGEDGELIIGDIMLPPNSGDQKGWDEKRARKIKLKCSPTDQEIYSSVGSKSRVEIRGKTVIKDFGTYLRIERRRCKYVVVSE
ncbi:MAG: hypothetical protein H5U06_06690 [Candidatus Aminicenantes bacterium]|nr:hypothetical protein [Candidatus Aminicenantes bacterium]